MAIDPTTGQEIPEETQPAAPQTRKAYYGESQITLADPNTQFNQQQLFQDPDRYRAADLLGLSVDQLLEKRRGLFSGQVTGDEGQLQKEATASFNERSALGASGNVIDTTSSYFDNSKGVTVHAPSGKLFQLHSGGGISLVEKASATPTSGQTAGKTSLFGQATQGGQAVEGFKEENLAITPAEGKEVARTGQTVKNPETGVDVHAKEGNILIEYTDGTVEERPIGSINQPGEAKPITEAGKTAEELGITRQTEIKGGEGTEVTRAPQSAAEALAAAQTPEEKDAVIQAEGLASTANLEFIGDSYQPLDSKGQPVGPRRQAAPGNAFYQDPASDKILERSAALQSLAQQSTSPSILAERDKAKQAVQVGGQPTFSQGLKDSFAQIGIGLAENEQNIIDSLRNRPIPSIDSLYTNALAVSGVAGLQAERDDVQKEIDDLNNKLLDDRQGVDENPWLSENLRNRKQDALTSKYEGKKNLLEARKMELLSLIQSARQEAMWLAGTALQQANADRAFDVQIAQLTFERADQRFNAQVQMAQLQMQEEGLDLQRQAAELDRLQVEQSANQFNQTFGLQEQQFQRGIQEFEQNFAEQARQFNAQLAKSSGTAGERAISRLGAISGQVENILSGDRNIGVGGAFTTIAAYRDARSTALQQGVSPDDFDVVYGNQLSPYDRLTYGIGSTTNISQVENVQAGGDSGSLLDKYRR